MKPVTVISLKPFLKAAKTIGLVEEDIAQLEIDVAYSPEDGDVIEGTGGIRKRRVPLPGRNRGKSGGGRLFTLFLNLHQPVFIIMLLDKSTSTNLTKTERNELADLVNTLKTEFRRKGDV